MRIALALLLLLAADETRTLKVTCPVDGTEFEVTEVVRLIYWGGVDRDRCRHTFKTLPMEHYIWVCPGCHFAGSKRDYGPHVKISDEHKKVILEGLKPPVELKKDMTQKDLPGWAKYDLLAQVQEIRGAKPLTLANTYLKASWAARQRGAVKLPPFPEWDELLGKYGIDKTPLEIGPKQNRAEHELKMAGKLVADMKKGRWQKGPKGVLAPYLAAYLYRRRGENDVAQAWITEVEKRRGQNSFVDEAVVKMKESIVTERKYQKLCAALIEKQAAAGLTKGQIPEVFYMLGELHRRLGDRDRARDAYDTCLDRLKEVIEEHKGVKASEDPEAKAAWEEKMRQLKEAKEWAEDQRKLVREKEEEKPKK
ncbi:MAG: DUF2225 domain-containing protein [Planctomycetota bacterium]|jgi:uncharacterized protein (DUF2225 family)